MQSSSSAKAHALLNLSKYIGEEQQIEAIKAVSQALQTTGTSAVLLILIQDF